MFKILHRISLTSPFVGLANMSLLLIMVTDRIGVRGITLKIAAVGTGLFVLWGFGMILDALKAAQHTERELIERSEAWKELFDRLDRIERGKR
jgi:hypothetical protein